MIGDIEVYSYPIVKGRMRGQAMATTTTTGLAVGKGTLPYTLACTVKSRPGLRRRPTAKREKKKEEEEEEEEEEKKLVVLPELTCLATYIGYVSRVSTCLR
jgi:hypothetical protein